jgi:histidinol-phosphate aminotransferase
MHRQRGFVKEKIVSKYSAFVRQHIHTMPKYQPVVPLEILSGQLNRSADTILKLDANENPYGPLDVVQKEIKNLPYIHIYPDPSSNKLCRALSKYHELPLSNIVPGAGADELIDLTMRLFLEPGDAIVNCPPTFGMYSFDALLNGATVLSVGRNKDFSLDIAKIEDVIKNQKPKLIFISSPNNPDGSVPPLTTIKRLLDLPIIVVIDEAYVDFAPSGTSVIEEVLTRENLIVLRTFSKWAGLAGLRVGYGVFPDWMIPFLWKIKQPYNVSVTASAAAVISLQHADALRSRVKMIVRERERLYAGLSKIKWVEPYPSHANFILFRVLFRPAIDVRNLLLESGIIVRHFDKPGLDDHIRVTVGKPEENEALLDRLVDVR